MIKITETEATRGFVSPTFFERTEQIKERVVDCTREELIDLCFHYLGMLEKYQCFSENANRELEEHLGYYESM
jgi:hypothetical protein